MIQVSCAQKHYTTFAELIDDDELVHILESGEWLADDKIGVIRLSLVWCGRPLSSEVVFFLLKVSDMASKY